MNAKKLFTSPRMIILVVMLIFAVILIHPNPDADGVAIRSVARNSSAAIAGIQSPLPSDKPMFREVVIEVDGKPIEDMAGYEAAVAELSAGDIINIRTMSNYIGSGQQRTFSVFKKQKTYTLEVLPEIRYITTNRTEDRVIEEIIQQNRTINGTTVLVNETIERTIQVPVIETEVIGTLDIGLEVYNAPTTNIKKGLDLQGGTRVMLQPETELEQQDLDLIIENLKQRLNVYGLSDIMVRSVTDLEGNTFIMVEVAGANEDEVKDLISRQGKFEAKIANQTVFSGGQDIRFVCRSADCSFSVNPQEPCSRVESGAYQCSFLFTITLSQEAAQRQADLTAELDIIRENNQEYLSENLDFYLDNEEVDSLRISAGLRGNAVTDIAITGPGTGATMQEAAIDSARNMKSLQTVLITGSLPVQLNIVKIDTTSPVLGDEFVRNALLVGLVSMLAVMAVVIVRYRNFKIAICMMITMVSEVVLLLGTAALIGWNLDLAAIAGIIIAVGTGVDHQIVITDETSKKKGDTGINWRDKVKNAFFIIMAAYFTTVVAMIPLWSAGAGLLRGFAITTIIGVSFGVFVTRPAFSVMMEYFLKD